MIKQLKLPPEILALQRQTPDDNTACAIKRFTLSRGACLTPHYPVGRVSRHSLSTFLSPRPQAKKVRGTFSRQWPYFRHVPFFFLNSVSESTRGSPPGKTGLIRCSRTKLSWFLSVFLSWGRPCRLHAIRIYSVLPLRLPSSAETQDTRDLSREESGLVPPPKPQRRPASPEVHKLPLNSEFCVSEYVNSQQQKI